MTQKPELTEDGRDYEKQMLEFEKSPFSHPSEWRGCQLVRIGAN